MTVDYPAQVRYIWVAYTQAICVCWEVVQRPNIPTQRQMVGFHIYGEVNSANVRHIPLRLFATADINNYPQWVVAEGWQTLDELPPQPSMREVTEAWMQRSGTQYPDRIVDPGSRRDHESADEFYQRVATNYRVIAADDTAPTKRLAELSGVAKGTAGKWVWEARRRGYLPPATKGKASV